jgi:hypothetical protein
MPWTNPETFTAGQTLTAASMNVISDNARMGRAVFTNEAARDAAITGPEEGMIAYLTAPTVPAASGATTVLPTGITTIYNGSAWVCVTPVYAFTGAFGNTTSGTYTATLSGGAGTNPSVTLSTGTTAMVTHSCLMKVDNVAQGGVQSVAVSGASTIAASDDWYVYSEITNYLTLSFTFVITGLTAGSNTFTLNYRQGSATNATYGDRTLIVQGIA